MSQIWFTADLHLGHGNIIKYCNRPFLSDSEREQAMHDRCGGWNVSCQTVQSHDDALIDAINERVAEMDVLWVVGDFSLAPLEQATAYRDRIRCREVNLVWGNHDLPSYKDIFQRTMEQGMIKHQGQKIWLNHYPMRSWDKSFHGAWHLYGHVHGRLQEEDAANPRLLARDVGVEVTDYRPLSFEEVADYMAPRVKAFRKWKNGLEE